MAAEAISRRRWGARKWLVALAVAVAVGVGINALINYLERPGVAEAVAASYGEPKADVSCHQVGIMLVVGKREDVYSCSFFNRLLGCYVYSDSNLYNVSAQARLVAELGGGDFGC